MIKLLFVCYYVTLEYHVNVIIYKLEIQVNTQSCATSGDNYIHLKTRLTVMFASAETKIQLQEIKWKPWRFVQL